MGKAREEGFNTGYDAGKQLGFRTGDAQARTELTKLYKHQRGQALLQALEQTTQALDAVAHLAVAIAKESL